MPFIAVSSSPLEEMNLCYESHGAGDPVVLIHADSLSCERTSRAFSANIAPRAYEKRSVSLPSTADENVSDKPRESNMVRSTIFSRRFSLTVRSR
jgi:hypothetical protein